MENSPDPGHPKPLFRALFGINLTKDKTNMQISIQMQGGNTFARALSISPQIFL
jgi:hypothetical protein